MSEEMIPIVMFTGLTIVFALLFWFKHKNRNDMQQTIRLALDKGHELSPELIDRLSNPKAGKFKDLRLALIWLALAIGLALCGWAVPDPTGFTLRGCLAGAAFPLALGVAYLIMYRYTGRD